jgi:membrane-bound lytic murein transglycosylase C
MRHKPKISKLRGKRSHARGKAKRGRGRGSRMGRASVKRSQRNIQHIRKYEPERLHQKGFRSIKKKLKSYKVKGQSVYYVTFKLAKNSQNIRAKKYLPYIKENSKKFHISRTLILAIIKTESDFNPYAVSYVPAFGLMQIVPTTAGVEGYEKAYGYKHIPSKDFLFVPKNNIKIGTAYLNILFYKYLKNIKNPISKEYCAISAYNSGIGNVLRVFSTRRDRAYYIINSLSPKEVYNRLTMRLPTNEGRRYLPKVIRHKKLFIGY